MGLRSRVRGCENIGTYLLKKFLVSPTVRLAFSGEEFWIFLICAVFEKYDSRSGWVLLEKFAGMSVHYTSSEYRHFVHKKFLLESPYVKGWKLSRRQDTEIVSTGRQLRLRNGRKTTYFNKQKHAECWLVVGRWTGSVLREKMAMKSVHYTTSDYTGFLLKQFSSKFVRHSLQNKDVSWYD